MTARQTEMTRLYGAAAKTEIPSGRALRPLSAPQSCSDCGCAVLMGVAPVCPTECRCHETSLLWFNGPGGDPSGSEPIVEEAA